MKHHRHREQPCHLPATAVLPADLSWGMEQAAGLSPWPPQKGAMGVIGDRCPTEEKCRSGPGSATGCGALRDLRARRRPGDRPRHLEPPPRPSPGADRHHPCRVVGDQIRPRDCRKWLGHSRICRPETDKRRRRRRRCRRERLPRHCCNSRPNSNIRTRGSVSLLEEVYEGGLLLGFKPQFAASSCSYSSSVSTRSASLIGNA
jgi:hypothetical protein